MSESRIRSLNPTNENVQRRQRRPMSEQRIRILDAATDLFFEEGFEHVSVEKIATAARVSKTAIYEQFGGKDALIEAVIAYSCEKVGGQGIDLDPLGPDFDLREALTHAGRVLAQWILHPEAMAVIRLALGSYNVNPKLAKIFWEHGPVRATHQVAEAVARTKKQKRLRKIDPHDVSIGFANEIVGRFLFTSMMGVTPYPKQKEINRAVEQVVDETLDRYGLA